MKKRISVFEETVFNRIQWSGLKLPEREYLFIPNRRFRFDFAWPGEKVALECEGGSWVAGRHTRGAGFQNDCRKYNLAVLFGWRVLRYTPQMVDEIIDDLKNAFDYKSGVLIKNI